MAEGARFAVIVAAGFWPHSSGPARVGNVENGVSIGVHAPNAALQRCAVIVRCLTDPNRLAATIVHANGSFAKCNRRQN